MYSVFLVNNKRTRDYVLPSITESTACMTLLYRCGPLKSPLEVYKKKKLKAVRICLNNIAARKALIKYIYICVVVKFEMTDRLVVDVKSSSIHPIVLLENRIFRLSFHVFF